MTSAAPEQSRADALGESVRKTESRAARRSAGIVWLLRIGFAVFLLGIWYAANYFKIINPLFLSDPLSVASYLVQELASPRLWRAIWATFQGAVLGLLFGGAAGIATAAILHEIPALRKAVNPFITFFNALPRPALAPIFLLWFGLGLGSKVAVAISIVYFVLLLNTLAGLDATQEDQEFLAKTLKTSRTKMFFLVRLPTALPSIVAGLRLGAVYAVLGVVVAEMVASYEGLGVLLVQETNRFNIAGSFGILAILASLAGLLDLGVSLVERRVRARSSR